MSDKKTRPESPAVPAAAGVADDAKFFVVVPNGGTLFEPAYELAVDLLNRDFPEAAYNRFVFRCDETLFGE